MLSESDKLDATRYDMCCGLDETRAGTTRARSRLRWLAIDVAYLPGLAICRITDRYPGEGKTDARDALVIADAARTMAAARQRPQSHRPNDTERTDMARVEVLLPQWGMGMSEGTITSWLKAVGDTVKEDEALAEVEAEKVEETLEAPTAGTLVEILVPEGETVEVRTAVAVIEDAG